MDLINDFDYDPELDFDPLMPGDQAGQDQEPDLDQGLEEQLDQDLDIVPPAQQEDGDPRGSRS